MKTFKASEKEWTIEITIGAVRRIRDIAGIDLWATEPGPNGIDVPVIASMMTKDWALSDMIWAVIKPQADGADISRDQFEDSLDGRAFQDACNAFWMDLESFCQGQGRQDRAGIVAEVRKTVSEAVPLATKAIGEAGTEARSGLTSTDSPGSSGPTPNRGPSETSSPPPRAKSVRSGAGTAN